MTRLPEHFPDARLARVVDSPLDLVGATPLVRVLQGEVPDSVTVLVKLDQFNYGASSKDRIGLNLVRTAIRRGELQPGDRIVDTGAGNTAIGLALAGIATGHPSILVADDTLSPEKRDLLEFLGVEIRPGRRDVPRDHPENWLAIAERIAREEPHTWWARQESSTDNPESHQQSTGPEIWRQTDGSITHFLAAVATGGTVSGTGRYLHEQNPSVQVIGTDFTESIGRHNLLDVFYQVPGHEGLEHNWPHNIDVAVLDGIEHRPRGDVIRHGWQLARTRGLILGPSSVLSLLVARDLAQTAPDGSVIVSFSADSGRDYLKREYNAAWLADNGFADIADDVAPGAADRPAR